MLRFGEIIGVEKTVNLAQAEPNDVAVAATVKATSEVPRIDPSELELQYLVDSQVFNSINKSTQAIMSANYELRASNKNTLKYFLNFLEKIGDIGEDITWDEMLESIFQHQMIYGNAYVETILNKSHNKIVDLAILDPKRIDYAKNAMQQILMDKYGKPIGYTQKLPWGVSPENKGDDVPGGLPISLLSNQIFLLPERICHFKLYTYGDRFYGVGLIEPSFSSGLRKQKIEIAQTNSIEARGTFPLVDYVGDEFHEPTPQQIDGALKKLKDFKHNRYFAFPYWHKLEPVTIKSGDIVSKTLRYLRENQSASLGMPLAFATGSGEATNRATLKSQQQFLNFTLNDIVKKTVSTIRKYIFKRICNYNSFAEIPKIVWGDIGAEETDAKTERIVKFVNAGILTPEEAHSYAVKSEELEKP